MVESALSHPLADANEEEGQAEQEERQTDVDGVHGEFPFRAIEREFKLPNLRVPSKPVGIRCSNMRRGKHVSRG